MKRRISLLLMTVAVMCVFAACGCEHEWNEATCETPKTCTKCGETEGDAAEHEWTEATCETPKTCTKCDKTEGDVAEHEWTEATCEAPKTCTKCSKTEGDALEHVWSEWSVEGEEQVRICSECETVESKEIDREEMAKQLLKGRWVADFLMMLDDGRQIPFTAYSFEFTEEGKVTITFDEVHEHFWEYVNYMEMDEDYNAYTIGLKDANGTAAGLLLLAEALHEDGENHIIYNIDDVMLVYYYRE